MLQRIMMNTVCGRALLAITVTGILLRMITVVSYKRMKNAAENAGKTKRQWVQILKKRFENYERFGRIGNVEAFVEHYFSRKGILGIPLGFWDKSVFFLSLAALLTGISGAFVSFIGQAGMETVAVYLFGGAASSISLFMLHTLGNTAETKQKILVALTDYLANGMVSRNGGGKDSSFQNVPTKSEVESMSEAAVTEEEKQILAEVLEEYFW